ncbi:MAG: hypothetical protein ALAOOOJD_00430 [bacterium]|nr:hypothetical protein [bacterium]
MKAKQNFFRRRMAIETQFGYSMLYFLIAFPILAGESIRIGYTNHWDATAYSNGRRMVRTADDRRVVVYQDILAGQPVVVCVQSHDGVTWSSPSVVAPGAFPALAVNDENWIYLVWRLEDGQGLGLRYSKDGAWTWEPSLPIPIRPEDAGACQFPVIEATAKAVHVVWQQKNLSASIAKICYQRFDKKLSGTLTPILTLSADKREASFPIIAGDLEFQQDFVHLLWSESPTPTAQPYLVYRNLSESAGTSYWGFNSPATVPQSTGKSHPSISVRNIAFNGNLWADIILACADAANGRMAIACLQVDTSGIKGFNLDSLSVGTNAMPSVDDVYRMSCAMVWQNEGHIFYGQTRDEHLMTIPPLRVCSDQSAFCRHPNVGYKTFRRDSIDVVWTAGEQPPYQVMYRRLAKQYGPVAIEDKRNQAALPKDFDLSPNYPNPVWSGAAFLAQGGGNPTTFIVYSLPQPSHVELKVYDVLGHEVRMLVNDQKPAGRHRVQFNGEGLPAGLYFYRLRAGEFVTTRKMLIVR